MDPVWDRIHELAGQVAGGAADAWPAFVAALEPKLRAVVRLQKIGRLRSRDDDLGDIVVAVLEKLRGRDHATLRGYFAMERPPSFAGWIRQVVRSCAIDHLRGHPEYRRPSTAANAVPGDDRWISLATLDSGDGAAGLPDSLVEKRRQVVRDIDAAAAEALALADGSGAVTRLAARWKVGRLHARRLVKKAALYPQVLTMTLAGHDQNAIAAALALSRREVELIIRYIEEFLQARYRHA